MRLDSDQNGRRSFYERFLSVALDFGSTDMCALCKYTLLRARRSDSLYIPYNLLSFLNLELYNCVLNTFLALNIS